MSVEIVALTELPDMYAAVELQKDYWGENIESVVPAHMLFTIAKTGGHILAGYDSGRMVGVLIGVLATTTDNHAPITKQSLAIYSKRMVVLPDYRGQGIGNDLKWLQREIAIKQGIEQVIWTYDPLLSRNAHLNIRKLGCVCKKYLVNYFGADPMTGLASSGASDRFEVIWYVDAPDVVKRVEDRYTPTAFETYLDGGAEILNLATHDGQAVYPNEDVQLQLDESNSVYLVEVPLNFTEIVAQNQSLAGQWVAHMRTIFTNMEFDFKVVDFVRGSYQSVERGFYVVECSIK